MYISGAASTIIYGRTGTRINHSGCTSHMLSTAALFSFENLLGGMTSQGAISASLQWQNDRMVHPLNLPDYWLEYFACKDTCILLTNLPTERIG